MPPLTGAPALPEVRRQERVDRIFGNPGSTELALMPCRGIAPAARLPSNSPIRCVSTR
jgi:hypothetical protein